MSHSHHIFYKIMISSEFTAGGFVTLGEKRFRLDYESHKNKEIMYIPHL